MVVFTQGPDPTYVVYGDTVLQYPVHKLTLSEIVDTNGAGDAFAGGLHSFNTFFLLYLLPLFYKILMRTNNANMVKKIRINNFLTF